MWACGLTLVAALASSARAQAPEPGHDRSWHERYARARAALLNDDFAQAAREFSALADSAATTQDALLARELGDIARAQEQRSEPLDQPALRTTDELMVLYTIGVFYGLGTAAWLALQLKPQSFGAAILPFAVLTPAAVGVVAWADDYRPLRHGIPHAIAAGMYLGFGEGLWLVGYQNAYASHHPGASRWGSERVATALWATSTAGALAGTLVGALRRPTPGRVSFTASTTIWGGVLSAFAAKAIEPDKAERSQRAYLVGALGYNVGLVAGLLLGPSAAPSVARIRFTDLGGLFGALLGGGGYALVAKGGDSRVGFGLAAIGGTLGLGITWWATSSMPPDRSHDRLQPAIGGLEPRPLASLRPTLTPIRGGLIAGVTGEL
jgi:hypothetical protein